ncbi:MAG: class I SAM-dependent methyltransferase [Desulfobacteraceae bacterium]|nr:class I SAM-dependent methyltransferase [Desulfobacteraceae bacterium]
MEKFETKQNIDGINERQKLYKLFAKMYNDNQIDQHIVFQSLGLFLRNSGLAKILFINELYEMILERPGVIMEFGCHTGQNLVLFENLRAIYEPFNNQRRIIGFDSFEGYKSVEKEIDGEAPEIVGDGYLLPSDYKETLSAILRYHEENSVMPHHSRCEIVDGDVMDTAHKFVEEHPGEIVALAYFDLATYNPTKVCLEAILPRLIPGSLLLMDEFNFRDYPGASIAFLEVVKQYGIEYTTQTSKFMRDRTIVTISKVG